MSLYLSVLVTQFIGPLTLQPGQKLCSFQPIHANAHLTDLKFEKVFSVEADALRPPRRGQRRRCIFRRNLARSGRVEWQCTKYLPSLPLAATSHHGVRAMIKRKRGQVGGGEDFTLNAFDF